MKNLICLSISIIALSGCASSGNNDRLDAIERQLSSIQRSADQAIDLARQSQTKASEAASDAGEAQRMARQAMETATETAERLNRMESECCGGK